MQLQDQLKTNDMMQHDGNMNETEKQLQKKELEAYMMGDSGTKSFIGQPYNGIPSNVNNQQLHDETFSSNGFNLRIHNRFQHEGVTKRSTMGHHAETHRSLDIDVNKPNFTDVKKNNPRYPSIRNQSLVPMMHTGIPTPTPTNLPH